MSKRYTVSPKCLPSRQSYVATFRNATGKRGVQDLAGCPAAVPPESRRLYFGPGGHFTYLRAHTEVRPSTAHLQTTDGPVNLKPVSTGLVPPPLATWGTLR